MRMYLSRVVLPISLLSDRWNRIRGPDVNGFFWQRRKPSCLVMWWRHVCVAVVITGVFAGGVLRLLSTIRNIDGSAFWPSRSRT